jgi:hypothetical protein
MTVEQPSAPAPAEPLFTTTRTTKRIAAPGADPAGTWEPSDEQEPEVRLSLVETLMDSMGGPVVQLGPAPVGFIQPPPPALGPRHVRRKGMVRNFRSWWKEEGLARAGQQRAFAMAETILRSQAAQVAAGSAGRAPAVSMQAHSIRSMLELTEERFQALGLRSDRVQDELSSIARSLQEMRGQLSELVAKQRAR